MKRLIELVELINKHKIKQLDVIGLSNDTSAPQRLYDIISEKKIETDKEAAQLLLGNSARNAAYKRAKNKLLRRLINTVLFIDAKKAMYSNYQNAYYNCWKNFAAAKILVGKSSNLTGNALLAETLHIAEKYEFTELAMHISKQLRYQYGGLEGKRRLFDHYNEICKNYTNIFQAESIVDEYYTDLITDFIAHRSQKSSIQDKATEYLKKIDPLLSQFNSYQLHLRGRSIHLLALSTHDQKEEYLQTCDEAVAFFENKRQINPNPIHVFLHHKIVLCIQDLDYEIGKAAIEAALSNATENTHNWFLDYYYKIMLSLRCGHYEEAYHALILIQKNKQLKFQTPQIIEGLKLAEAYLFYLAKIGAIKKQESSTFKIETFLRKVPTYSKDKGGLNIPILIIQILFLIQRKDHDLVSNRLESLKRYGSKYIKKDKMPRVNCFINMLAKVPISRFHREATFRNSIKLQKYLQELPIQQYGQNYAIEIIPYENLWEMVIASLDNKMYYI